MTRLRLNKLTAILFIGLVSIGDGSEDNEDRVPALVSETITTSKPILDELGSDQGGGNRGAPHDRCHWGTPGCHISSNILASMKGNSNKNEASPSTVSSTPSTEDSIPLAHSIDHHQQQYHELSYRPPDGFTLSAHIITNPDDGLSYFADARSSYLPITIPFQECGAVGSTTEPIALKAAYFRHFPQLAHPTTWSTTQQAKILVALSRLEITVSGKSKNTLVEGDSSQSTFDDGDEGETRIFEPGDVVLVEDFFGTGYKMRAAPSDANGEGKDLSVLILIPSLSSHHSPTSNNNRRFSASRSSSSSSSNLSTLLGRKPKNINDKKPCDFDSFPNNETGTSRLEDASLEAHEVVTPLLLKRGIMDKVASRRLFLAIFGFSLSTAFSYFLSKVAPLQLAVVAGGAVLIGGGTYGIIQLGEHLYEEIEAFFELKRFEKRQLKTRTSRTTNSISEVDE